MKHGRIILTIAFLTVLFGVSGAWAFDETKYPNWKGQWSRDPAARVPGGVQGPFDSTKASGRAQQAPLTPEYQVRFEANLKDQAEGGQGNWQAGHCYPVGMPGMMTLYRTMEILITPETT